MMGGLGHFLRALLVAVLVGSIAPPIARANSRVTTLTQGMSAEPSDAPADVAVDSIEPFSDTGGWAVVAAGSEAQEIIAFQALDRDTRHLLRINRFDPVVHAAGTEILQLDTADVADSHAHAQPVTSTAEELLDSSADSIQLRDVSSLNPAGGWLALVSDARAPELIHFGAVHPEDDRITDVLRADPRAHPAGATVILVDVAALYTAQPKPMETPSAPYPAEVTPSGQEPEPTTPPDSAESYSPDPPAVEESDGVRHDEAAAVTPTYVEAPPHSCDDFTYHQCVDNWVAEQAASLCEGWGAECRAEIEWLLGGLVMTTFDSAPCDDPAVLECVQELLDDLDALLNTVCRTVVSPSARNADFDPYHCVEMVGGIVSYIVRLICGPLDVTRCVNNHLEKVQQAVASACQGFQPDSAAIVDHPCVRLAQQVVADVLMRICRTTDPVDCTLRLLGDIDKLLWDTCSGLEQASAIEAHPCIDAAVGLLEMIVRVACRGDAAVSCVQTLIAQIDTLLRNACRSAGGGTDSHECISLVLKSIDEILKLACGGPDAVSCVETVIAQMNTLLRNTCRSAGGGSESHECVSLILRLIDQLLTIGCGSTNVLTCVSNLISRIDQMISEACRGVDFQDGPSYGGHPCVDLALEAVQWMANALDQIVRNLCPGGALASPGPCVDLVVGEAGRIIDAVCPNFSCAGTLLDTVRRLLEELVPGCVPAPGLPTPPGCPGPAPVIAALVEEPPDDSTSYNFDVPAETDPETPSISVPSTPSGQILVLDANILQAFAEGNSRYKSDCTASGATKICNAPQRERAFARRVQKLASKPLQQIGQHVDGMRYAPDVLLLQEARCEDAYGTAAKLAGRFTGSRWGVAKCRHSPAVKSDANLLIQADTAIVYNRGQVRVLDSGTSVTSRYESHQRPASCQTNPSLFIDIDGDGESDCKVKWKRHYLVSLQEIASGRRFAVASVHYVTNSHLAERDQDALKAHWSAEVVAKLESTYPAMDSYVIAGDTNMARCADEGVRIPADAREPQICSERPWWLSLSRSGYVDSIYHHHGDPLQLNTQEDLDRQYWDGCRVPSTVSGSCQTRNVAERPRVDYILNKRAASLISASHDLNCGFDDPAPNVNLFCDEPLHHPRRYSDHRLLWSLFSF